MQLGNRALDQHVQEPAWVQFPVLLLVMMMMTMTTTMTLHHCETKFHQFSSVLSLNQQDTLLTIRET